MEVGVVDTRAGKLSPRVVSELVVVDPPLY
jgi:hypothetical protein